MYVHSHGTVDLVICVLEGCAVDSTQGAQEGLLAMELLTLQGVTGLTHIQLQEGAVPMACDHVCQCRWAVQHLLYAKEPNIRMYSHTQCNLWSLRCQDKGVYTNSQQKQEQTFNLELQLQLCKHTEK